MDDKNENSRIQTRLGKCLLRKSMELNIKYGAEILIILKLQDTPTIYCSEKDIKKFFDSTFYDKSVWKKIVFNEDLNKLKYIKPLHNKRRKYAKDKPRDKKKSKFFKFFDKEDPFCQDSSNKIKKDEKINISIEQKRCKNDKNIKEFDQVYDLDKNSKKSIKPFEVSEKVTPVDIENKKGLSKLNEKLSLKVMIPEEKVNFLLIFR